MEEKTKPPPVFINPYEKTITKIIIIGFNAYLIIYIYFLTKYFSIMFCSIKVVFIFAVLLNEK